MSNVHLITYINEYVKNTIPLSPIPLVSIPFKQKYANLCMRAMFENYLVGEER